MSSLTAFINENREALRDLAVAKVRATRPDRSDDQLAADLSDAIDEIAAAMKRAASSPEEASLPPQVEPAARRGRTSQRLGYDIESLAQAFGSISEAVGELGGRAGLSFEAGEYQIFNSCLDKTIGSAIEQYWKESQKRVGEANNERTGSFVHELRNALSSALMAYKLLRSGRLGMQSNTGDILGRSLTRMHQLIDQALAEVNLEAHVPLQPRRLNAARFLGELKEAVVSERGIAVKTEVDEMLELHIDERLMTSALTNLLQNGVKFSRAGGTVVLRAHPDGERVVIDVEDQCGGLPPGKEEELFQPFVQRSVDRRGLGLGLTIVRQAIEAHGGRISVRNRPGVGCTFSAVLPDAVATRGSIVPRP